MDYQSHHRSYIQLRPYSPLTSPEGTSSFISRNACFVGGVSNSNWRGSIKAETVDRWLLLGLPVWFHELTIGSFGSDRGC